MSTDANSLEQTNNQLMDEAEKLIWALLDERIEEADTKRLDSLLQENEQVRSRYLHISQIHANLYEHYGKSQNPTIKSPVLSFLADFSGADQDHSPISK